MAIPLSSEDIKIARSRMKAIAREIAENSNLGELLCEIDEAISLADEAIVKAILENRPHTGVDALKDELWQLKFSILEKS